MIVSGGFKRDEGLGRLPVVLFPPLSLPSPDPLLLIASACDSRLSTVGLSDVGLSMVVHSAGEDVSTGESCIMTGESIVSN